MLLPAYPTVPKEEGRRRKGLLEGYVELALSLSLPTHSFTLLFSLYFSLSLYLSLYLSLSLSLSLSLVHRTAEDAQAHGEDEHVAEVEGGLKGAVHFGLEDVVVVRVQVDVDRHRRAGQEACPLPPVVLRGGGGGEEMREMVDGKDK